MKNVGIGSMHSARTVAENWIIEVVCRKRSELWSIFGSSNVTESGARKRPVLKNFMV